MSKHILLLDDDDRALAKCLWRGLHIGLEAWPRERSVVEFLKQQASQPAMQALVDAAHAPLWLGFVTLRAVAERQPALREFLPSLRSTDTFWALVRNDELDAARALITGAASDSRGFASRCLFRAMQSSSSSPFDQEGMQDGWSLCLDACLGPQKTGKVFFPGNAQLFADLPATRYLASVAADDGVHDLKDLFDRPPMHRLSYAVLINAQSSGQNGKVESLAFYWPFAAHLSVHECVDRPNFRRLSIPAAIMIATCRLRFLITQFRNRTEDWRQTWAYRTRGVIEPFWFLHRQHRRAMRRLRADPESADMDEEAQETRRAVQAMVRLVLDADRCADCQYAPEAEYAEFPLLEERLETSSKLCRLVVDALYGALPRTEADLDVDDDSS